jgi:hypothetical protein
MAAVRASPLDLAERYGLVTAGELIPDRVPITRGAGPVSVLPVTEDLRGLLPAGGLAGQVAIPTARLGATSLMWRLLAGPSTAGLWCAIVGVRRLYPLAATAAGVALDHLALVDVEGPEDRLAALGALCEGVPVVVVSSSGLTPRQVQRAASRARRSGTVLVWRETSAVPVAGVDARLIPESCRWRGLRENTGRRWGAGRLDSCRLSVAATWRDRGRPRRAEVWPYGHADAAPGGVVSLTERRSRGEGLQVRQDGDKKR